MSLDSSIPLGELWSHVANLPPNERRELADKILASLHHEAPRQSAEGKSVMKMLGLWAGATPPPDDEQCQRILEDELLKKCGMKL
ncbi:MAG: hypothetical protein IID44_30615 [Planctomycetes bacterium]|nr:hypothetical protein [Planctomycetota bacterium]